MARITAALRGVEKRFGATQALKGIDLEFEQGRIHALLGENGSGKSTATNILSGVYQPDNGTVELNGQPISINSPSYALRIGIGTVYQDNALVPTLSVAENIMLGHEKAWLGVIRPAHEIVRRSLAAVNLDIDPATVVGSLSAGLRQVVAIAKVISRRVRVLILDEPTAALTSHECDNLFQLLRRLREQDLAIVYITHRLSEVGQIADEVSILRNGQVVVARRPTGELTQQTIVSLMTGQKDISIYPKRPTLPENVAVAIEARDVSAPHLGLQTANIAVRYGEVVGIAGLDGSGREALSAILGGAERPTTGSVEVDGASVRKFNPAAMIRRGVVYVPPDRFHDAIIPNFDLTRSVTLSSLWRLAPRGLISRRREIAVANGYVSQFSVKARSVEQYLTDLSGGNQQKIILSRALCTQARVIILCEPTAGVDPGARAEIYKHIRKTAAEGKAFVVASTDLAELAGICDHVVVLRHGKVVTDMPREHLSEQTLLNVQSFD